MTTTQPLRVIKEQRAKGWPDFHPEDYCHMCGGRNLNWYAPSELWNAVMGGPAGIICPLCFAALAAAKRVHTGTWKLTAETWGEVTR